MVQISKFKTPVFPKGNKYYLHLYSIMLNYSGRIFAFIFDCDVHLS